MKFCSILIAMVCAFSVSDAILVQKPTHLLAKKELGKSCQVFDNYFFHNYAYIKTWGHVRLTHGENSFGPSETFEIDVPVDFKVSENHTELEICSPPCDSYFGYPSIHQFGLEVDPIQDPEYDIIADITENLSEWLSDYVGDRNELVKLEYFVDGDQKVVNLVTRDADHYWSYRERYIYTNTKRYWLFHSCPEYACAHGERFFDSFKILESWNAHDGNYDDGDYLNQQVSQ